MKYKMLKRQAKIECVKNKQRERERGRFCDREHDNNNRTCTGKSSRQMMIREILL